MEVYKHGYSKNIIFSVYILTTQLVQLTNYEFEILYLLAKNPGRIFSKEQIYTQVWKEPYYGAEDNVMGIIRRIRKKIEPDSAKPRYILNVWGMGYKFNGELMK